MRESRGSGAMILLGLDPGLQATGWGVVARNGTHLRHVADGTIRTDGRKSVAERLLSLAAGLRGVFARFQPTEAALESSFFHMDAAAALKLGKVCGVCLVIAGEAGVPVREYPPNLVKKAVVGHGHADKRQIRYMVGKLLAGAQGDSEHAADALAVALCHAQHRAVERLSAREAAG